MTRQRWQYSHEPRTASSFTMSCPRLLFDFIPPSAPYKVVLLHGTKPDSLLSIISGGPNERFSGGLFGNGTYFAEDAGKNDQYVHVDAQYSAGNELHKRLYAHRTSTHPGDHMAVSSQIDQNGSGSAHRPSTLFLQVRCTTYSRAACRLASRCARGMADRASMRQAQERASLRAATHVSSQP